MVRPERRTRADLVAVVLIVVAALVGSLLVWVFSDARATVSRPAAEPVSKPREPVAVPARLREVWRAPSAATPEPVVAGPAVVTAHDRAVLGRDPRTGEVRWRYSRDVPLCTVGSEWDRALAVYRKAGHCSEVTSLRGPSGERGPQRNASIGAPTRLLSDGTYVTATGRQLFETWRSDLVRTQQYGVPTAIKNPDNNLDRPKCEYASVGVGDQRVGVIEECPSTATDRVTVLKAKPEDDEDPEEVFTRVLDGSRASVVAVSDNRVAVLLRESSRLAVYDFSTGLVGTFPVDVADHVPAPGGVRVEPRTLTEDVVWHRDGHTVRGAVYWHTGRGTVALDPVSLTPLWNAPGVRGPGTVMAGELLLPVDGGIAVHDPRSGRRLRVIPVDRGDHRGPVRLSTVGGVVLEQRGNTLVALR